MPESPPPPSSPTWSSPWADDTLALLARHRPNVAEMSGRAEKAVLQPADPGGWPIAWRLGVAADICESNGLPARAAGYRRAAAAAEQGAPDPAIDAAARAFAARVAADPRGVAAGDVAGLQAGGVSDADVVRLCELVAFVSYQCRVEIGHALLEGAR